MSEPNELIVLELQPTFSFSNVSVACSNLPSSVPLARKKVLGPNDMHCEKTLSGLANNVLTAVALLLSPQEQHTHCG